MNFITLKGHNNGYKILLEATASSADILQELKELCEQLSAQAKEGTEKLALEVDTGDRLLSAEEKAAIITLIEQYSLFEIERIHASVIRTQEALEMIEKANVHPNAQIIRNGQIEEITGDVLFLGDIHEGGILRATGNIYLLGTMQGIAHAGYPNNDDAVIIGDVSAGQQVRIGDLVEILEDRVDAKLDDTCVYVNELHLLEYGMLNKLQMLRPKIFMEAKFN